MNFALRLRVARLSDHRLAPAWGENYVHTCSLDSPRYLTSNLSSFPTKISRSCRTRSSFAISRACGPVKGPDPYSRPCTTTITDTRLIYNCTNSISNTQSRTQLSGKLKKNLCFSPKSLFRINKQAARPPTVTRGHNDPPASNQATNLFLCNHCVFVRE